ncbi:MAG: TetR/AcrR family transcriptional regulator [Actinomycetota bacterium]|nr:TetR/AcrR family transcriptional regulator [Actinomycetota bacterium]
MIGGAAAGAAAPAGRREATKAANRAAILRAAREIFGELGYGAAGIRDIVRRAGLASGTFYNYFADKEAVFRAIVDEIGAEAGSRVAAARARAATPQAFVEDAYRAYFDYMVADRVRFAFMRRNVGEIRLMFDDVTVPAVTEALEADLAAAIARGDLPAADVEYTARTMVAVGLELGSRLIERDPPDVDGATRFATDLFLGGLPRAAAQVRTSQR